MTSKNPAAATDSHRASARATMIEQRLGFLVRDGQILQQYLPIIVEGFWRNHHNLPAPFLGMRELHSARATLAELFGVDGAFRHARYKEAQTLHGKRRSLIHREGTRWDSSRPYDGAAALSIPDKLSLPQV